MNNYTQTHQNIECQTYPKSRATEDCKRAPSKLHNPAPA